MNAEKTGLIARLVGRVRGHSASVATVAQEQASAADLIDAADLQLMKLKADLAAVMLTKPAGQR